MSRVALGVSRDDRLFPDSSKEFTTTTSKSTMTTSAAPLPWLTPLWCAGNKSRSKSNETSWEEMPVMLHAHVHGGVCRRSIPCPRHREAATLLQEDRCACIVPKICTTRSWLCRTPTCIGGGGTGPPLVLPSFVLATLTVRNVLKDGCCCYFFGLQPRQGGGDRCASH
jgi:hypothetical protein